MSKGQEQQAKSKEGRTQHVLGPTHLFIIGGPAIGDLRADVEPGATHPGDIRGAR
jgi:hypothetical protein